MAFNVEVRLAMTKHYYGEETDKERAVGVRGRRTGSAAAARSGAAHIRSLIRIHGGDTTRVLKLKIEQTKP